MKIHQTPGQMSEVRYQELFDRMSSGVAVYKAKDDGEDFVLLALNRAGQRITRVTGEYIGRNVSDLSAMAAEIGLPSDAIEGMRMAGLIHDLGKILVPAEILNKASRLTEIEFNLVRRIPKAGMIS